MTREYERTYDMDREIAIHERNMYRAAEYEEPSGQCVCCGKPIYGTEDDAVCEACTDKIDSAFNRVTHDLDPEQTGILVSKLLLRLSFYDLPSVITNAIACSCEY